MILPYADDNTGRKINPFFNYLLIAINIVVFIVFQKWGNDIVFTYAYCTVPAEIISNTDIVTATQQILNEATQHLQVLPGLQPTPIPVFATTITSIFLHGGIAHLLGNMLFLHIFGDNIENYLGHTRYLLFYLFTGIIASLSHVATIYCTAHNTLIPCIGASGAISAVMGAYLRLYPNNKVRALIFYFPVAIPAIIALGLWIGFQVLNSLGIIGGNNEVAYAAHIGGFIAGFVCVKWFR
jgi:membrane associated rhomboid family serine protease